MDLNARCLGGSDVPMGSDEFAAGSSTVETPVQVDGELSDPLRDGYAGVRHLVLQRQYHAPEVEKWIATFSERLVGFRVSRGYPADDAWDCVQEFWLDCFKYGVFEKVEPGYGLAYYWAMFLNRCYRKYAQNKKTESEGLDDVHGLALADHSSIRDPILRSTVWNAICRLGMRPGNDGWLLWMNIVEELSYAEIAALPDVRCEANALKTRCHRAKQRARRLLAGLRRS